MKPFALDTAGSTPDALRRHAGAGDTHWLMGGTTQVDLMKLNVLEPDRLVDITPLRNTATPPEDRDGTIQISAFMSMHDAAGHALLRRRLPMLVESLSQAASRQIRMMASLGGNVLQRTRCGYYRDTSWKACNRRDPGSGCAARENTAWAHAVLGTSEACIAIYPGDLAQALVALDATIEVEGVNRAPRLMRFADLHRLPGRTPELQWNLTAGDLITGFRIPAQPWMARSRYVKVRDRASYEFALASAAVALDLDPSGTVREARIGLGGGCYGSLAGARGRGIARGPACRRIERQPGRGDCLPVRGGATRHAAPPRSRQSDAGPRAGRGRRNGDRAWLSRRPSARRCRAWTASPR